MCKRKIIRLIKYPSGLKDRERVFMESAQMEWKKDFDKKIQQVKLGKEIFAQMFDANKLRIEDTFLLELTENEECIGYALDYLPDFIKKHHKRNVYILTKRKEYEKKFSEAGGIVKLCDDKELDCLAIYFNVFHRKEWNDTRIIFLTEKDGYGFYLEELLEKKEFSLEEYIAVSVFQLDELRKRI